LCVEIDGGQHRVNEESESAPPCGSPRKLDVNRGLLIPFLYSSHLAEQAAMESRGAQDSERKAITALFADIKGSVELVERRAPEEVRAIVDPALQLMMDAVHRYEGYVAQGGNLRSVRSSDRSGRSRATGSVRGAP
jgi:hypothetical protein